MARILVSKRFDHRLNPRTIVALKPSDKPQTVKRETADAAIASGAAIEVETASSSKVQDAASASNETASVDGA